MAFWLYSSLHLSPSYNSSTLLSFFLKGAVTVSHCSWLLAQQWNIWQTCLYKVHCEIIRVEYVDTITCYLGNTQECCSYLFYMLQKFCNKHSWCGQPLLIYCVWTKRNCMWKWKDTKQLIVVFCCSALLVAKLLQSAVFTSHWKVGFITVCYHEMLESDWSVWRL